LVVPEVRSDIRNAVAWFTGSFRHVLYRIAIAANGTLALSADTVPLNARFCTPPGPSTAYDVVQVGQR
jgi:hypothetical protein